MTTEPAPTKCRLYQPVCTPQHQRRPSRLHGYVLLQTMYDSSGPPWYALHSAPSPPLTSSSFHTTNAFRICMGPSRAHIYRIARAKQHTNLGSGSEYLTVHPMLRPDGSTPCNSSESSPPSNVPDVDHPMYIKNNHFSFICYSTRASFVFVHRMALAVRINRSEDFKT